MVSQVRQPRPGIKINGSEIPGLVDWSWDGNSMFQADGFTATFAVGALPAAKGVDWWAQQTSLDVELFAGFPDNPQSFSADELESLFSGTTDELECDWIGGAIILRGRDLTARFLDNKTSEKFPNQTASQIATTLAGRRGLTPVVTATSTKVGAYYKDNHVRLQDDRTEWDLLTWLAREEGMVVFVKGKELHFEKAPTAGTYKLAYQPPVGGRLPSGAQVRISTSRVLTVARDISVTVHSWNPKTKKAIVRKATRNKKGAAQVQNYTYTIPNLTPEQAQLRANALLADLSRHEMRLRFSGPADNTLQKSDLIAFSGTGTAFDQTYYPDSIRRECSARGGYEWSVDAKNHSSESQPDL